MSRGVALCLVVTLACGAAAWRFAAGQDDEDPFTPPAEQEATEAPGEEPAIEEPGEPLPPDDVPADPDAPAEPDAPADPDASPAESDGPTPAEPPAPDDVVPPTDEPGDTPAEPGEPEVEPTLDAEAYPLMPEESDAGEEAAADVEEDAAVEAGRRETTIDFLPPIVIANPSDHADDWFGRSVAAVGNKVLVGGPSYRVANKGNAGAVFVFDQQGTLLHTIANPSPGDEDRFGRSLAALGNNLLVGAYKDDDDSGELNAGAAYLFGGQTSRLVRAFTVPEAARYDYLGYSLAGVGRDAAIVGAAGRRVADSDGAAVEGAGAAYLFDAASGELLTTFENPQPRAGDWFGRHVADAGNRQVLIAAPYADREFSDPDGSGQLLADVGEVYLYDAGTGELLVTFGHPSPAAKDLFGEAVVACGEFVLIGAPYADGEERLDGGAVYVFTRDGEFRGALQPNGAGVAENARFGYALAALGDLVVVGTGQEYDAEVFLYDPVDPRQPLHEFHAELGDADASFGTAVATAGGSVVIGAPRADVVDALGNTIPDSGRVFLFHPRPAGAARRAPGATLPVDR
jgi:hypothetical protein